MSENIKKDKIEELKNLRKITLFDKINEYIISVQGLKIKDKVIFFRLLATMLNSGITVMKALSILEKQEKNKIVKNIFFSMGNMLEDGKNLSEAMIEFPNSFTDAEIGMVKAGEKTWRLNDTLLDLAVQVEKIASISWKIRGAMIYPWMILTVVLVVIIVMMTIVVPRLISIFNSKEALPSSTRVLIGISDFFVAYRIFIIFWIFIIVFVFNIWRKFPTGKYFFDDFILKIPVFGELNQKLILSKFARVFSGLLSSGVSIVEAIKIVSEAVGNEVYRQRIVLLVEDIKQWMKLGESLEADKMFPDMMVQMIQVWEQTAKVDQTISKVADFYDEQVDNMVGVLNKLLEPFIIIFLAIIVGFIAIAIMQPIMNLADTVSQV